MTDGHASPLLVLTNPRHSICDQHGAMVRSFLPWCNGNELDSKSSVEGLRHFLGGPKFLKLNHLVLYRAKRVDAWMGDRLIGSTSEQQFGA